MTTTAPLPAPDLIRRVRRIEIKTRRIVADLMVGSYHSVYRGRGMEFAQVREYCPGDDVRTIDWNVTSRSTRPDRPLFVKVFAEERELTVIVLADVSGSTAFGTGAQLKREVVAEIAALLAFTAIGNRDRVGLVRFSDRIEQYLAPRTGSTHALRVVRDVLGAPTERRRTDLAGALSFLLRVQRKPAVVFLLSDLLAPDFERPLKLAAKRHDLTVFELVDPAERQVPSIGLTLFEDAETGDRRLLDLSSARVRESLAQTAAARRATARAAVRRSGAELVTLDTKAGYEGPLLKYFRQRAARIRR